MDAALYLTYNEMFFQLIFNMLCALIAAMVAHVLIEAPLKNLLAGRTEMGASYESSLRAAKLALHADSLDSASDGRPSSSAPRAPHLQSTSTAFASERDTLASAASAAGSRDQTLDGGRI